VYAYGAYGEMISNSVSFNVYQLFSVLSYMYMSITIVRYVSFRTRERAFHMLCTCFFRVKSVNHIERFQVTSTGEFPVFNETLQLFGTENGVVHIRVVRERDDVDSLKYMMHHCLSAKERNVKLYSKRTFRLIDNH